MDYVTVIGLLAGTLCIIAFLPQVIKTWKTKLTRDISLLMYIIICIGNILWIIYGIFIMSLPVILTNAIILMLALTILIFGQSRRHF